MPNTNFQTIFQMGQAINDMVKQATGRDVVKTIEMGQVTVAQNHISTEHTYSGDVVSFVTNDEYPMQIGVDINPVQDLHGYDNPWPAGGGKNLFDKSSVTTGKCLDGESYILKAWGNVSDYIHVEEGQTYFASNVVGNNSLNAGSYFNSNKEYVGIIPGGSGSDTSFAITIPTGVSYVRLNVRTTHLDDAQFEKGSSGSSYVPYSNICPITGWTEAKVTVANGDDLTAQGYDSETYTITFPDEAGTVYGGTLTINKDGTGTLVMDRGMWTLDGTETGWDYTTASSGRRFRIAVSNLTGMAGAGTADTLKSDKFVWADTSNDTWGHVRLVSDYLNFTDNNSVMADKATFLAWLSNNNTQVFAPLATTITYTITDTDIIKTIVGENVVSADTGNITVSYDEITEGGGV